MALSQARVRVVEEHYRRRLPISEDKLPALAGVAKYFAAKTSDRRDDSKEGSLVPATGYPAGLRWDMITEDLSWSLHSYASKGERPCRYRAPSWSWASMDGAVEYRPASGRGNHLAIARDASVHLDSAESLFSKVTGGWRYSQALRISANPSEEEGAGSTFGSRRTALAFMSILSGTLSPSNDASQRWWWTRLETGWSCG